MTPSNYAREVDDYGFTQLETFEQGNIALEVSANTIVKSIHIGGAAWKTAA